MTTLFEPDQRVEPRADAPVRLRPYQQQAVDQTCDTLKSADSALIVSPVGSGKTPVLAELARHFSEDGRVLILAHRRELIRQARQQVLKVTGIDADIEMADEHDTGRSPVLISSIQTQGSKKNYAKRRERFDPNDFSLIIVDEAHRAVASSYIETLEHYKSGKAKVVGCTATPDRRDEVALGKVFEEVAFEYDVMQAIRDGWLVPPQQRMIHVESLDFSGIRTQAGDLNGSDLAEVMEYERNLWEVVSPTLEISGDELTIAFAASVAHAERMSEMFNREKPDSARVVSQKTSNDNRSRLFRDFAEGSFQYLANVGIATEGYDNPLVSMMAMARPTKSRALYAQCMGRIMRPVDGLVDQYDTAEERKAAIAASSKPTCTVLDFVGNAGKHKLVHPADVLGGNYDDDVVERARKKAEEKAEDGSVPEDVAEELDQEQKAKEAEEQEEHERKLRQAVKAKAKYKESKVDPFDVLDVARPTERGWDKDKPITEKQKDAIERISNGKVETEGLTKKQASKLMDKLVSDRKNGKPTFGQANLLRSKGLNPNLMNKDQASKVIDQLKANRWEPTPDMFKHWCKEG